MLRATGRQIAKRHKTAQRPHGRQSVKKLMAHGENVNSIEVEAPKLFDRMARRFNVDYAFYKTGPDKYLLFFKAGQADAITACFERYSRRLLEQSKSSRIPIREQLKKAAEQLVKEPPKTQERTKEVVREERYARKLAENINQSNLIDARVPSILIAGGSNFPVRKKEKQNAARDKNMGEYMQIEGLLDSRLRFKEFTAFFREFVKRTAR